MVSNLYCRVCGTNLVREQETSLLFSYVPATCGTCGLVVDDVTDLGVRPDPSCEIFCTDPSTVLSTEWFHYTWEPLGPGTVEEPTWLSSVIAARIWVHVGTWTSSTALARHRKFELSQSAQSGIPRSLYTVRIKPEHALIDPIVASDLNYWPDLLEDGPDDGYVGNVVRYVNAFEAPGQVSLLIDPNLLEVVAVSDVDSALELV